MSSPFSAPRFSMVHLEKTNLRMCLLSCPGIRFTSGSPVSNIGFLEEDLARLQENNVKMVVSCLTAAELLLGADTYASAYERLGIDWHLVPIPDMTPPSAGNDIALNATFKAAEAVFNGGNPVAFHCLAGLGRTGTVAARLTMTYGLTAADAITFIRTHHDSKAIETKEQEAYLLKH